jgi:hypothetical protein
MKPQLRALPWQCMATALTIQFACVPSEAAPAGVVSCATPDMWTGTPRLSTVSTIPSAPSPYRSGATRPRIPVTASALSDDSVYYGGLRDRHAHETRAGSAMVAAYRGQGVGRLRGLARNRVLAKGVIWSIESSSTGMPAPQVVKALLKAGASYVWSQRGGRVRFRAREEELDGVLSRAASSVGGVSAPSSATSVANVQSSVRQSGVLGVDVAMLRIDSRLEDGAVRFIETLPNGMSVMPFGTAFAVHVPASLVPSMWNSLDEEGGRTLLVGASSEVSQGGQVAQAIGQCGGTALMSRFPTPGVSRADMSSALLEVEGQRLLASVGDIVLVVQNPPFGKGVEIALMRFVRR